MEEFDIVNQNGTKFRFICSELNKVPENYVYIGRIEIPSLLSNFGLSILTGFSAKDNDEKIPMSFKSQKLKELMEDNNIIYNYCEEIIPDWSFHFNESSDRKDAIKPNIDKIKRSIIPRKTTYNVWLKI